MARLRPLELHEVDGRRSRDLSRVERKQRHLRERADDGPHRPRSRRSPAFRKALAKESVLDPTLIELVRLKVAERNACHY